MSYNRGKKAFGILAGLCAVAVVAACAAISAQNQPKPETNPPSSEHSTVRVQAKVSRIPLDGKGLATYKFVKFTHNDTVLVSDLVTYDKETDSAVSTGKLTISDPECDIAGDKGTASFKKKLGIIEGNVTMLLKPKPENNTPPDKESIKQKLKKPTTVTCPKIEYQYKDKIATLSGPVNFKQDKRSGSAKSAVWDGKKELLTLTGDVNGTDEDGQTFAAPVVILSVKKGDEWMEAENGSASIKVDLGEENKSQVESPKSKVKGQ